MFRIRIAALLLPASVPAVSVPTVSVLAASVLAIFMLATASFAAHAGEVEEQRLTRAREAIPSVVQRHEGWLRDARQQWQAADTPEALLAALTRSGEALWQAAKRPVQTPKNFGIDYDDRPLYWARVQAHQALRNSPFRFPVDGDLRARLHAALETSSRGQLDLKFPPREACVRVLITGFDPFLLDRHINQSNPSGLAALTLDNQQWTVDGKKVCVQSAVVPVRYGDFDEGKIEALLTPWMQNNNVDLIATVSMGRAAFDLERFPGRRRSAGAPDNDNVYSGGNAKNPVIPKLHGRELDGPEFVEFSLPVASMLRVQTPWTVKDNCDVQTLEKSYCAPSLQDLAGSIAVNGGGGGYLSNEISYRSIRLRDQLGVKLPVGHIHTPAIRQYDPATEAAIVAQIGELLRAAVTSR